LEAGFRQYLGSPMLEPVKKSVLILAGGLLLVISGMVLTFLFVLLSKKF
jgi:hypothetical protein